MLSFVKLSSTTQLQVSQHHCRVNRQMLSFLYQFHLSGEHNLDPIFWYTILVLSVILVTL